MAASCQSRDKSLLHNVNERPRELPGKLILGRRAFASTARCSRRIEKWWSQTESNRRPQACKASALPTELWPRRNTRIIEARTKCNAPATLAAHSCFKL
jgi:hypothetical protein